MAYKYEVFISYRHESLSRDWIHKWFLQTFKDHFESLFQKEQGIIFIDTSEILSSGSTPMRSTTATLAEYIKKFKPKTLPHTYVDE